MKLIQSKALQNLQGKLLKANSKKEVIKIAREIKNNNK